MTSKINDAKKCSMSGVVNNQVIRGIFRTQSKIYDGTFLRK